MSNHELISIADAKPIACAGRYGAIDLDRDGHRRGAPDGERARRVAVKPVEMAMKLLKLEEALASSPIGPPRG